MEHESEGDTKCNCALGTVTKGLEPRLEDLEIRGQVETIQNDCIIDIGQNTKKSPGDLRLAVTQPSMEHNQLTLVWKTRNYEGLGCWRTGRDYPNDSSAENGQNTEVLETWGDLLSLKLQWKNIS